MRGKRVLTSILLFVLTESFKLGFTAFVWWINSLWLVPLGETERGYDGAYGAEYMVLIIFAVLAYWIAGKAVVDVKEWIMSVREYEAPEKGKAADIRAAIGRPYGKRRNEK